MTDTDVAAAAEAPATDEAIEASMVKEALAFLEGKAPAEPEPEEPEEIAPAAAEAPGDDGDIWATDALREAKSAYEAQIADLRTKWDRERGRTSALQRKIDTAPAARPAPEADPDHLEDVDKALAKVREEYPDLGEALSPLAEAVRSLNSQLKPVKERFAAQDQTDAASAENAQTAVLSRLAPDFDVVMKAAGQAFWDWSATQPPWVQRIVDDNAESLTDAEGVAEVFARFKASQSPAETPTQEPRLDSRRARQIAGAAAPKPTSRTVVSDPTPTTEAGMVKDALRFVAKAFPRA